MGKRKTHARFPRRTRRLFHNLHLTIKTVAERSGFLQRSEGSALYEDCEAAKCGYHCSLKSSQVGFPASISAIFLARVHPLSFFSRWIAALTSVKRSNQTRRLQLYRAGESGMCLLLVLKNSSQ